ncbi:hypothetical protein Nepgr_018160 [Nepenthes gracilis]|uniref:DUF3598 domain-containing protein n=1 Tax=Nepenthes gracilis TaxID=150966 RepID=A0AAD3XTS3_NEPGR|nr:hypothetical protein Nepgr_018160 [Nepenthes gracilis]
MASSAHSITFNNRRSVASLLFPCLSSNLYHYPVKIFNPKPISPSLHSNLTIFASSSSSFAVSKSIPQAELEDGNSSLPVNLKAWSEFADKVSGEWDGHGADFTSEGKPIELPEYIVPEAYREWDVKVHDWQTQCPTLAEPEDFLLSYKLIRLLPTVGCEADAATIYSTDEWNIGGEGNRVLAFAYLSSGSYVAVWPTEDSGASKLMELEHCLVDPQNRESRIRIIQVVQLDNMKLRLQKIKVFCEQWYGPFRNGEQLGGCAIRDSRFASTDPLKDSEVIGVWQSHEAVASFKSSQNNILQELMDGRTQKIVRSECDLIMLPRHLWCSLKERENGETCGEVGWLLDRGSALSSRCIFSSDGKLKEIAVGYEVAGDGVV